MKITFLGTGASQGVPVIGCSCPVCLSCDLEDKRLRSSVHVSTSNLSMVIDTSPDFRQQMLHAKINYLNAVLYTHNHRDHTAGLDDIRPYNFKQQEEMPLYASAETAHYLSSEFRYAFGVNKYPGTPSLQLNTITDEPFVVRNELITPLPVTHNKIKIYGFRIQKFGYVTDASQLSETTLVHLKSCEVVVINALQKNPHPAHFNLDQAIQMALHINAPQTYFTHISHLLGRYKEVQKSLPPRVYLAYDGLSLSLSHA